VFTKSHAIRCESDKTDEEVHEQLRLAFRKWGEVNITKAGSVSLDLGERSQLFANPGQAAAFDPTVEGKVRMKGGNVICDIDAVIKYRQQFITKNIIWLGLGLAIALAYLMMTRNTWLLLVVIGLIIVCAVQGAIGQASFANDVETKLKKALAEFEDSIT